jgi:hypothetical protein
MATTVAGSGLGISSFFDLLSSSLMRVRILLMRNLTMSLHTSGDLSRFAKQTNVSDSSDGRTPILTAEMTMLSQSLIRLLTCDQIDLFGVLPDLNA